MNKKTKPISYSSCILMLDVRVTENMKTHIALYLFLYQREKANTNILDKTNTGWLQRGFKAT